MRICMGLLVGMLVVVAQSTAEQPPEAEILPPPRVVTPDPQLPEPRALIPPLYRPDPPPQLGRRDVWQMFAPDRTGRFRPRVIYSPYGSYYQYNGAPYPWTTTRPNLFMPYVVD